LAPRCPARAGGSVRLDAHERATSSAEITDVVRTGARPDYAASGTGHGHDPGAVGNRLDRGSLSLLADHGWFSRTCRGEGGRTLTSSTYEEWEKGVASAGGHIFEGEADGCGAECSSVGRGR
jgi:hypothetical protein